MARGLSALGYGRVAVTPHIRPGLWLNSPSIIAPLLSQVQTRLEAAKIPLSIEAGAEHFFDPELEGRLDPRIGWGRAKKTFLIELPHNQPPPRFLPEIFFRLRVKGMTLLLAHPERYRDPLSWIGPLREQGVRCQISLTSLGGKFGRTPKVTAQRLIEEDQVDLVATDAHKVEDLKLVAEALRWLERARGAEITRRFTEIAPTELLDN